MAEKPFQVSWEEGLGASVYTQSLGGARICVLFVSDRYLATKVADLLNRVLAVAKGAPLRDDHCPRCEGNAKGHCICIRFWEVLSPEEKAVHRVKRALELLGVVQEWPTGG